MLKRAQRDDSRHLDGQNAKALRQLQAHADTGASLRAAKMAMRMEDYKRAVEECVLYSLLLPLFLRHVV